MVCEKCSEQIAKLLWDRTISQHGAIVVDASYREIEWQTEIEHLVDEYYLCPSCQALVATSRDEAVRLLIE